jgi:hypothetical protein
MRRPVPPKETEEVYIPTGKELDEARHEVASKRGGGGGGGGGSSFHGDMRMVALLLSLTTAGVAFGCVYLLMPWVSEDTYSLLLLPRSLSLLTLAFVVALYFMMVWAYAVAIVTPPGSPPSGWTPLTRTDGLDPDFDPFTINRKIRWCDVCGGHKPMRAHHCRVCGVCVLRGDHHCMWTANCVGYRNHKAFFLFLMYLGLLLWMGILLPTLRLGDVLLFAQPDGPSNDLYHHTMVAALLVISLVFQSYAGSFFQEQLQLIVGNVTTLEKKELLAWKRCYDEECRTANVRKRLLWPFAVSGLYASYDDIFHDGLYLALIPTVRECIPPYGTTFAFHPKYVQAILSLREPAPSSSSSSSSHLSSADSHCGGGAVSVVVDDGYPYSPLQEGEKEV